MDVALIHVTTLLCIHAYNGWCLDVKTSTCLYSRAEYYLPLIDIAKRFPRIYYYHFSAIELQQKDVEELTFYTAVKL